MPIVEELLKSIMKIYIISTFIYFLVAKIKHWPLKSILLVSVLNTIAIDVLEHYDIATYGSNNIYIIIHAGLWYYLIKDYFNKKIGILIGIYWSVLALYYISTINIQSMYYNLYFASTSILYIIFYSLY